MARRAVLCRSRRGDTTGRWYRCAQSPGQQDPDRVNEVATNHVREHCGGAIRFRMRAVARQSFSRCSRCSRRIFPSRRKIFFFGIPAGDTRFAPPALPTWLFQEDLVYGMPTSRVRGLKIAFDEHASELIRTLNRGSFLPRGQRWFESMCHGASPPCAMRQLWKRASASTKTLRMGIF